MLLSIRTIVLSVVARFDAKQFLSRFNNDIADGVGIVCLVVIHCVKADRRIWIAYLPVLPNPSFDSDIKRIV